MSAADDHPYMARQATFADKAPNSLGGECDRALKELDRLRRWKAEATEVINGWDELYEACQIEGTLGMSKSHNLAAYIGYLEGELARKGKP